MSNKTLIFDIEGNDLWEKVTRVHCIVTKDTDTGEVRRFRHHSKGKESLEAALRHLEGAALLIGHNVLGYDLGALKKLYPSFDPKAEVFDTQVVSSLIFTNLMEMDSVKGLIPTDCYGWHSLRAWGYRLKCHKGDFGGDSDDLSAWAKWSPEMEDYCAQDVEVTHKLYRLLVSKNYSETAIQLEHDFKKIIVWQERHGFRYDVAGAEKLTGQLQSTRHQLTEELQKVFPPIEETMKTPDHYLVGKLKFPTKGAAKAAGYKEAQIKAGPLRIKLHHFNPGSRKQIADRLIERYGWKPRKYTEPSTNYPQGQVAIDEAVLAALPYPEAKLLNKYLLVGKILGQVAEGDNACLKLQRNGRIHGRVSTNGTVTGRCSHSTPNIAQTPSVTMVKGRDGKKTPLLGLDGGFGFECRSLFLPDPGHVLVGWDASGLELRCLAHFLYRYDGGKFGELVTDGDPHTANQEAAGLYLRDSAKTLILILKDDLGASPRLKLGELRETPSRDNPEPRQKLYRNRNRAQSEMTAKASKYPQGFFKRKPCRKCSTEFQPEAPSHLYCSQRCADSALDSAYLLRAYGIPVEEYHRLHDKQGGRCAICKGRGFVMDAKRHKCKLVVDHCHTSGTVRGLLCHNCNRGLGLFQDSVPALKRAVKYLQGATTIPSGSRLKRAEAPSPTKRRR